MSSRAPTRLFPYGYGKVQFLSANIIGVCLIIGSLAFLWHNLQHVGNGHIEPPLPAALIGALVSAATAEVMHRYLTCVGLHNNSPAVMAAAADNRGDALSSLAVLAGVALSLLGWRLADHLAAILVSLLVLRVGVRVAWSSIHGLMDGSIPADVLDQAREIAASQEGVVLVQYLRGRRMGETWSLDMCLHVPAGLTTADAHDLSEKLKRRLVEQMHHTAEVSITFVPAKAQVIVSEETARAYGP